MQIIPLISRRFVFLFLLLLPLAACSQEPSPWENMNYNAAIHSNSGDDSI